MTAARIQFKTLRGFPEIEERIETLKFLIAAKEVVNIIETFGKLFTPVVTDMNGNITKLMHVYELNTCSFQYLEDLIVLNLNVNKNITGDALLWLKRGLDMIYTFFENIFYDTSRNELLKLHLQDAYERTLKPYHGFIVQKTIKLIYSWIPTRSQLIGDGIAQEENLAELSDYLPRMQKHLKCIDGLLKKHKLDVPVKV